MKGNQGIPEHIYKNTDDRDNDWLYLIIFRIIYAMILFTNRYFKPLPQTFTPLTDSLLTSVY